jgi:hypothetical protein
MLTKASLHASFWLDLIDRRLAGQTSGQGATDQAVSRAHRRQGRGHVSRHRPCRCRQEYPHGSSAVSARPGEPEADAQVQTRVTEDRQRLVRIRMGPRRNGRGEVCVAAF